MRWSPQQSAAIDEVAAWHRDALADKRAGRRPSRPVMRVFGYAGTGKTTIARAFADRIDGGTVYAAYTGKAALMMARNGCADASTIHGMIYKVEEDAYGRVRFRLDRDSPAAAADLMVIDECSMVDAEIGEDLLSFRTPVLVLGDPAQLPPVKGAGFFTDAPADVMLTEIHRQAAGNPIIRLATAARSGERIEHGQHGESRVVTRGTLDPDEVAAAGQVLVGKNATRRAYNQQLRRVHGFEGPFPRVGEKIVCLRNDKPKGIFNGGLFSVTESGSLSADRQHVEMVVRSDDFPDRAAVDVRVRREFFDGSPDTIPWQELRGTQQFDFGYALTVHKAQGSQWGDVIAYDESAMFREDARRWLYTALTRAADRITLVTD